MRFERSSAIARISGAAIVSGTAWLAWELSRRLWDDGASSGCSTSADYFNDTAFALANLAAAVALASSSLLLRAPLRWVALAAALGAVAAAIGNSVEHCVAEPFFLLYVAGALTYTLATCALGVGLLITGQLGRFPGLLLGAAALGLLAFDSQSGGAAVTGIAWLGFGALLVHLHPDEAITEIRSNER